MAKQNFPPTEPTLFTSAPSSDSPNGLLKCTPAGIPAFSVYWKPWLREALADEPLSLAPTSIPDSTLSTTEQTKEDPSARLP